MKLIDQPEKNAAALPLPEGGIACGSCGLTMAESHTLYDLKRGAVVLAQTQNDEILSLHRQLAGEKLRADQGWARAEAKSGECIDLRERMAAGAARKGGWKVEIMLDFFSAGAIRVLNPDVGFATVLRDSPDPGDAVLYRYFEPLAMAQDQDDAGNPVSAAVTGNMPVSTAPPVERRVKAARALADIRFGQVLDLNADKDKLLTIIAAAYQVAGAHDAPAHILDVLADPEAATAEQVDAMLPYQPVMGQAQGETKAAGDAGAAQTCRSRNDARPAAPAPDQIAWAHELQTRVMLVDDDGDDDLHNLLGEVACCLAALAGRPDPAPGGAQ